jgi:hypothetical protein
LDGVVIASPVTSENLATITEKQKMLLFLRKPTPLPAPTEVLPWPPQSVWDSVIAVLSDQQGLRPEEVLYHARFVENLGVA